MSTPTETNRAEVNKANSQHSTGPKSPEGKQRSAQNALRHGLTAQQAVLPTEDPAAYQLHLDSFTDHYDPQGPTEVHLVQVLADTSWRQNRIISLESSVIAEGDLKGLANLSLHSQRLSRQFERTVAQLNDLQQVRKTQEAKDLSDYLDITEMYESKKEAYDPADDGFVFSKDQINQGIRARNRERSLEEAQ